MLIISMFTTFFLVPLNTWQKNLRGSNLILRDRAVHTSNGLFKESARTELICFQFLFCFDIHSWFAAPKIDLSQLDNQFSFRTDRQNQSYIVT